MTTTTLEPEDDAPARDADACDCEHCCGVPLPAPGPTRGLSALGYALLDWAPGDEDLR